MSTVDFDELVESTPSDSGVSLEVLTAHCRRLIAIDKMIREKEAEVKILEQEALALRSSTIPNLMMRAGVEEWKVTGESLRVKLAPVVKASLMKDPEDREKAAAWLAERGHGAIVKRDVVVSFGIGQSELAEKTAQKMREEVGDGLVSYKVDVHHSTLSSVMKTMFAEGEELPNGTEIGMSLYAATEAKVVTK